jgi:hypothetical protein
MRVRCACDCVLNPNITRCCLYVSGWKESGESQCQPTVNHNRYYIVNKQKKQPNFWVWAWCLRIEAHRKYGCTEPKPDCPPPAWLQRNKEKDCGWTWGSSEILPQGRHRKCCLPALGSIYALESLFYLIGYSVGETITHCRRLAGLDDPHPQSHCSRSVDMG